jgi:hypothetical protein
LLKAKVPGHIEDFDADTATITWGDSLLPPPDRKDPHKGRLIVKTLLPGKRYVRRIGGKGYEFWALGANHPPKRRGREVVDKPDDGNWRLEISPAEPKKFDNFLNLIRICDTRTAKPPASQLVEDTSRQAVGAALPGWVVIFGRKGRLSGEVSYPSPAGRTRHLVLDLPPGAKCALKSPAGAKQLTASKEGVLDFVSTGAGKVTITVGR